ncbi:MAG: helix-turn-helix transcriptional regulator [Clostridia bacterium]|nr:helix-turn-helix transcriptional regulator [Clostridia bacterium]
MDIFTDRIRLLILQKGLQQKQLASLCKLSPARLNNYLAGRTEPSLDVLQALCKALDVSADYLIGLSDTPSIKSAITIPPSRIPRDPLSDLPPEVREDVLSYAEFKRQQYLASTKQQEA